jgi:hypothetical protein
MGTFQNRRFELQVKKKNKGTFSEREKKLLLAFDCGDERARWAQGHLLPVQNLIFRSKNIGGNTYNNTNDTNHNRN